ncbi:MAG: GH92 family glycosyl hydrolase, partial [Bacteroidales bacterium]|nr:GH92 family glycosyl hydrolase [Bacteroidales bacterium]
RLAKEQGYEDDYAYFLERSYSYRHYFDPDYKLMNGLSSQKKHRRPFDPFFSSYKECDWVEGNSWQYSFFVPHDLKGLVELYGSKELFSEQLDSLFAKPQYITGEDVPLDITGFIGQYVHGNEPSHQVAYLYNYTNEPWKGQLKLREIMRKFYGTTPDGLCGNEDCGQMSSWYIFSALGFYPVNPASGIYILGTPMVENATLHCDGNEFHIVVENQAEDYPYVRAVFLNGQPYTRRYITHKDIMSGGELRFVMGDIPNKDSEYSENDLPPTSIVELNTEIR